MLSVCVCIYVTISETVLLTRVFLAALALETTSSLGKLFMRQLDFQATVTLETLQTSSLDQLFALAQATVTLETRQTSLLGKLFMLALETHQARSLGHCKS